MNANTARHRAKGNVAERRWQWSHDLPNSVTVSGSQCEKAPHALGQSQYLIVYPLDGRNIHVVGGGAHIFILLVGEDVNTNQVNLH